MVRKVIKFCPLCGAENPVDARNCKECGSPFEESSIREVDEGPQIIARKQSVSDSSGSSDSSGGSGSSSSSDSSNASFPRPMAYLISFSLMFFLAMIYFIIF